MAELDEESLRSYFDEMDVDKSGELDKDEVKRCLRAAGKYGGEAQLAQLFEIVDTDGNGTIDFEEFKILMSMPDKEDPMSLLAACLAELVGVMLFQFFGGLKNAGPSGNGMALVVLIYCTAAISGGHLNPAVTLGLAVTRQIPPMKALAYWVAQFTGGIIGAAFYYALDPSSLYPTAGYGDSATPSCTLPCGGAGLNPTSEAAKCTLNAGHIFGMEFLATFLLVFTVFGTAVDPQTGTGNLAPIAIGFSLYAAAFGIAQFTGAGLNPARTLCPALVFDCWSIPGGNDHGHGFGDTWQWVYALAQFSAGACAGLVYMAVFLDRPNDGASKAAHNTFKFMANETKLVRQRLDASAAAKKSN